MDHGSHMPDTGMHDATAHADTSHLLHTELTHSEILHENPPSFGSLSQPQHYDSGNSHPVHHSGHSGRPHSQHDNATPHGQPHIPHKPHHPLEPSESPPPYAIVDVPWVPTPEQRPLLYSEQRRSARRRYAEAVRATEAPWTNVQCMGLFVWLVIVLIIGFVVYSMYAQVCSDPWGCGWHP